MKQELTKVGRNEPCPCGSGLKYKRCCWHKGFTWEIFRCVPLHPEMRAHLERLRQEYIATHGKEPGPDTALCPTLAGMSDEEIENEMATIMEKAGVDPSYIYAFRRTGFILSVTNQHLIPDRDVQAWTAAVEEYRLQNN